MVEEDLCYSSKGYRDGCPTSYQKEMLKTTKTKEKRHGGWGLSDMADF